MLFTGVAIPLSLFTLIQAAAVPQTANNNGTSSAATGYKNVAYFVNWVCFASQKIFKIYFIEDEYRLSIVVTSTLKIFQANNLLTFSMPLLTFDQRPAKST
jgi:hypothetical protein